MAPSRESNSGLLSSKPTKYQLSYAATYPGYAAPSLSNAPAEPYSNWATPHPNWAIPHPKWAKSHLDLDRSYPDWATPHSNWATPLSHFRSTYQINLGIFQTSRWFSSELTAKNLESLSQLCPMSPPRRRRHGLTRAPVGTMIQWTIAHMQSLQCIHNFWLSQQLELTKPHDRPVIPLQPPS